LVPPVEVVILCPARDTSRRGAARQRSVVAVIKGSVELWPTLVEIGYFEKSRRGLPRVRIDNRRRA
jgi:hypothetical protein